jgi:hypothetical protein
VARSLRCAAFLAKGECLKLSEVKLERYFACYEFGVPYLLSPSDIGGQLLSYRPR